MQDTPCLHLGGDNLMVKSCRSLVHLTLTNSSTTLENAINGARWIAEGQDLTTRLAVLNSGNCSLNLSDALGTGQADSVQNVETCTNTSDRSTATRKRDTSVCNICGKLDQCAQNRDTERAADLGKPNILECLSGTELDDCAALGSGVTGGSCGRCRGTGCGRCRGIGCGCHKCGGNSC